MLASLQAVEAWGFPFIDVGVGGFGVNSVTSSVQVERLASFFSVYLWWGSTWVELVAGHFRWLV